MFERQKPERLPDSFGVRPASSPPTPPLHGGYDDGFDPARQGGAPMSPQATADEAAMALADDTSQYRPWILQRGARAVPNLHMRRFDPRSHLWQGWVVAYPQFVAAEYLGDTMLCLDFGMRQFMLEGRGFGELVDNLQSGSVLRIQEYASACWRAPPAGAAISVIRLMATGAGDDH